ncbi:MAG: hypothetical protein ABI877_07845, partial [Gemmatimonadaceae bacterium]
MSDLKRSFYQVTIHALEPGRLNYEVTVDRRLVGGTTDRTYLVPSRTMRALRADAIAKDLYKAVLPEEAGEALREIIGRTNPGAEHVVLRLNVEAPQLRSLPWELLPPAVEPVLGKPAFSVVRWYREVRVPSESLRIPMRILIADAAAMPSGAEAPFPLEEALRAVFGGYGHRLGESIVFARDPWTAGTL